MMQASSTVTRSPAAQVAAPAHGHPLVSIVTVAFGTGPLLVESVSSVVTTTTGVPIEYLVVSNPHPERGTRSATHLRLATSGIRLIEPSVNTGFGGGCELGALHARGEFVAFVNPDLIAQPGWLEPLIAAVRNADRPTIAAPVLLDPDGTVQEAGARLDRSGETAPIRTRPAADAVVEVDYASAACWLMGRRDLERLGGFDAAYHPAYYEDVDLAWRCRRAGGRCVVVGGSAVVHHKGQGAPDRTVSVDPQRDELMRRWPELAWSPKASDGV